MIRTRLLVTALLTATALPGCGIFCGDRQGVCERMRERREDRLGADYGIPVSFPGGGAGCGTTVLPPGATIVPGPGTGGLGSETLPPPYAGGEVAPRIPKAGIKESPGKQFELDPMSKMKGPVLTIPTTRGE